MKKKYTLKTAVVRSACIDVINKLPLDGTWSVTVAETDIRTLQQNATMWGMLEDISKQALWHGIKMSKKAWKDLFTSGVQKTMVIPNLDGDGFVSVGLSTREMTVKEMSPLIDLIYHWGSSNGVKFKTSKEEV